VDTPLCCGDLGRRFLGRNLKEEDYYLLFVKDFAPYVFMSRLSKLNKMYVLENKKKTKDMFNPLDFPLSDAERAALIKSTYSSETEDRAREDTKLFFDALYNEGCQAGALIQKTNGDPKKVK